MRQNIEIGADDVTDSTDKWNDWAVFVAAQTSLRNFLFRKRLCYHGDQYYPIRIWSMNPLIPMCYQFVDIQP